MKKLLDNSVIVIWSGTYIDDPTYRRLVDRRAKIIQIEPGSSDNDYIVEIVREEEDVKKDEFIKKRLNILKEE